MGISRLTQEQQNLAQVLKSVSEEFGECYLIRRHAKEGAIRIDLSVARLAYQDSHSGIVGIVQRDEVGTRGLATFSFLTHSSPVPLLPLEAIGNKRAVASYRASEVDVVRGLFAFALGQAVAVEGLEQHLALALLNRVMPHHEPWRGVVSGMRFGFGEAEQDYGLFLRVFYKAAVRYVENCAGMERQRALAENG